MQRTFGQGIAVGFASTVLLVQLVLSWFATEWARAYADFGGTPLLVTRVTTTLAWRAGVPALGAAAIAWLLVRPGRSASYVVIAVVMTVAAALTWYGPSATMWALAGAIK